MYARVFSLSVVALGAIYFYLALQLPLQTLNGPGAGLFPLAIGAMMVVTGIATTLQRDLLVASTPLSSIARRKIIVVVASLAAFCFLLPRVGYIPSGILVMVLVLRQFEAAWKLTLTVSILGALGTYFLFAYLLGLPFPRGSWLPI
jgi:putative tricarboxylic transport membrane protein